VRFPQGTTTTTLLVVKVGSIAKTVLHLGWVETTQSQMGEIVDTHALFNRIREKYLFRSEKIAAL